MFAPEVAADGTTSYTAPIQMTESDFDIYLPEPEYDSSADDETTDV
jgi:hypothetical protein